MPTDTRESESSDAWATVQLPESMRTFSATRSLRPLDYVETVDAVHSEHVGASSSGQSSRRSRPSETAAEVSIELAELPSIHLAEEGDDDANDELVITGRLGEGGMGIVDRAWQRSLSRAVAIKRIRDRHTGGPAVRALLTEARVMGSLEHPNIIPIHAVGRDADGNPALVMKRVAGARLAELVRNDDHPAWTGLPSDRLRWYVETRMQVCHAVELAHSRGVMHRDLKLDNIMVGPFGEVYVLDWGLALPLANGTDAVVRAAVAGTPSCMAPEMLIGGPLDRRTDVYLLGAALHELLLGAPRHPGETLEDAVGSILASAPVNYDSVPEELAAVANRATARNPNERFESVRALREALVLFLEHRESAVLCDEADRLLADVADDGPTRRSQLGSVRFAYGQALARWGGNARATAGMRTVVCELFHLEVREGHRAAAAALLTEISNTQPELHSALSALDERIAADRNRVEELEKIAEDHDPSRNTQARRRGLIGISAVASVAIAAALIVKWLNVIDLGHAELFLGASATAVVAAVAMLRTDLGRSSEINRRLGWSLTTLLFAAAVARGTAWWIDAPLAQMLTFELLGYSTAMLLIGIGLHRSFLLIAPVIGAGFLAAMAYPGWAMEIASLVMVASLLVGTHRWVRPGGPADKADLSTPTSN